MELLQLILGSAFIILTTTAFLVVLIGFFPNFTAQAERIVARSPGRAAGIGLVNLFFLGTITLTLAALGQNVGQFFFLPGLFFLAVLLLGMILGLLGIVQLLGERLWPDLAPVKRNGGAAAVLVLASMTPFIGWFGFLPLLLILALGVCVMTFVGRLQAGRPQEEPAQS